MKFDISILTFRSQNVISRISLKYFIPISWVFFYASASEAQVVYGNPITTQSPVTPSQSFQIESGVDCPVSSFNVSGFYGGAVDNAQSSFPNVTLNSGQNNFGFVAGISIPLGGRLSTFCKEFAATKTENSRQIVEVNSARFQSELVQQCYYLLGLNIDFNSSVYDKNGSANALFPCREIVKSIKVPQPIKRTFLPSDKKSPSTEMPSSSKEKSPLFSTPTSTSPSSLPIILNR